MSIFKSNNINFDSSLYSDMQYRARNGQRSAIQKSRMEVEHTIMQNGNCQVGSPNIDQVLDAVDNFSREFFSRIYEDSDHIDTPDRTWQSTAHDICSDLPEFEQLKSICMDDSDFSAIATSQFLSKIKDQIADIAKCSELDEDEMPYQDVIDAYRGSIRNAINDINDDMGEVKAIVKQISGDGFGESLDRQKMVLDISNSKKIRQIMRRAGKLIDVANALPVKSTQASEDIIDIEYGRDISRITNQQKMVLADPYTEDLFYANWASHELELECLQGDINMGKGPIHILLDTSGSMQCSIDGQYPAPDITRNEWAKATAIAMSQIAHKENRKLSVTMFTYGLQSHEDQFLAGKYNYNHMIKEVAERVYDSGTNFNTLFTEILPKISENEDIVFITDGEDHIHRDIVKEINNRRQKGLRIFTIAITKGLNERVHEISDQVVNIAHLVDEEDISKALAVTIDQSR